MLLLAASAACASTIFVAAGTAGAAPEMSAATLSSRVSDLSIDTGSDVASMKMPAETVEARLWRGAAVDGTPSYPELELPELREKANSGVAFSGGGLRAFVYTLGSLRGLLDLNALQYTRYITGVSGGAWATAVFTFYDPLAGPSVARNDSELLGGYTQPSELDEAVLRHVPAHAARHCAMTGLSSDLEGVSAADWVEQIERVFLAPMGVPTGASASFSWDRRTADNIAVRNEGFIELKQIAVAQQRPWGAPPYPVLGIALLAPLDVAPLDLTNRSYTVLDATPLYFGQARRSAVTYYPRRHLFPPQPLPVTCNVSGLLQPFAVGGVAPGQALSLGEDTAMMSLPAPARPFSLGQAVAASSFFPADVYADFSRELSQSLGFVLPLWPPAPGGNVPPRTEEMMIGDGGLCENTLITSLVRRRVERIVWFSSPAKPLQHTDYNPYERPPTEDDMDSSFPSFFGVFTGELKAAAQYSIEDLCELYSTQNLTVPYVGHADPPTQIGWTYRNNQIFAKEDFAPLIVAMQASQANGTGAVASTTLHTVANPWYEVEGGHEIRCTVVYLSRAWRWEQSLPPSLRDELVPEAEDARKDMGKLRQTGEFRSFPHFTTASERFSTRQVSVAATAFSQLPVINLLFCADLVPCKNMLCAGERARSTE